MNEDNKGSRSQAGCRSLLRSFGPLSHFLSRFGASNSVYSDDPLRRHSTLGYQSPIQFEMAGRE